MPESAKKPPTSKRPCVRRTKVTCTICQLPIIDGEDEMLLCESECNLWFHRGYASVPPDLYKALLSSNKPFTCLYCTNSLFKQQITQVSATVEALREELKDAQKFRETCSALSGEVAAL